jgi:hypothetical protein
MIHPTEAGSRRQGNWLAESLVHLVQHGHANR